MKHPVPRATGPALAALVLCLALPTATHAQMDWHAPGAAGRVWGDKIDENNRENRRRTAEQRAQAAAADAAWEAPLSEEDIQGTISRNRSEYERQLRLGEGHAEGWLDRTARMERFKRGGNGGTTSSRSASRSAGPAAGCTADALPVSQRRQMEAEYAGRLRDDGKASADAWAHEQGRRFRDKLQENGLC